MHSIGTKIDDLELL